MHRGGGGRGNSEGGACGTRGNRREEVFDEIARTREGGREGGKAGDVRDRFTERGELHNEGGREGGRGLACPVRPCRRRVEG